MTQSQFAIMWAVAGLLALVFVYVNIVMPYQVNRAYDEQTRAAFTRLNEALGPPDNQILDRLISPATEVALNRFNEIIREQKSDPNARSNYFTGVVVPILILGACAFITAGRTKPASSSDGLNKNSRSGWPKGLTK